MIGELTEKVYEKLHSDFLKYLEEIKKLPANELENKIYEMLFKQEIVDMFYGRERYNKLELNALLKKDNLLDYLYSKWDSTAYVSDLSIENDIEEQIEQAIEIVMLDLATDDVSLIKTKIKNSPNYELIKDISETLTALDNYDFCYHLKDRFNVEGFDTVEVYEILNTKDGAKYIYDFCDQVRHEDQVKYLLQIHVLDNDKINNIEDKILPKLKNYINQQEKNKNKDYER